MGCTPPPLGWRQFFSKVPLRQNVIIKLLTTWMTPGLLEKLQQFQWKGLIYNALKLLWKRTWKGAGLRIEQCRKLQRIIVCNYLNLSTFWLAFHCLHIFLLFSFFFTFWRQLFLNLSPQLTFLIDACQHFSKPSSPYHQWMSVVNGPLLWHISLIARNRFFCKNRSLKKV